MIRTPAISKFFTDLPEVLPAHILKIISQNNVACSFKSIKNLSGGVLTGYIENDHLSKIDVASQWFYDNTLWFKQNHSYGTNITIKEPFCAYISILEEYRDDLKVDIAKPIFTIEINDLVCRDITHESQVSLF
jgi:hypothetical protein